MVRILLKAYYMSVRFFADLVLQDMFCWDWDWAMNIKSSAGLLVLKLPSSSKTIKISLIFCDKKKSFIIRNPLKGSLQNYIHSEVLGDRTHSRGLPSIEYLPSMRPPVDGRPF